MSRSDTHADIDRASPAARIHFLHPAVVEQWRPPRYGIIQDVSDRTDGAVRLSAGGAVTHDRAAPRAGADRRVAQAQCLLERSAAALLSAHRFGRAVTQAETNRLARLVRLRAAAGSFRRWREPPLSRIASSVSDIVPPGLRRRDGCRVRRATCRCRRASWQAGHPWSAPSPKSR